MTGLRGSHEQVIGGTVLLWKVVAGGRIGIDEMYVSWMMIATCANLPMNLKSRLKDSRCLKPNEGSGHEGDAVARERGLRTTRVDEEVARPIESCHQIGIVLLNRPQCVPGQ